MFGNEDWIEVANIKNKLNLVHYIVQTALKHLCKVERQIQSNIFQEAEKL